MRRSWRGAVVAVVLAGCTAATGGPAAPVVAEAQRAAEPSQDELPPTGGVVVAQPDPVGTWWQQHPEDVAAGDLAALWSLPLYRTDDLGRQVPALARSARTSMAEAGWTVEVDLAEGAWSDGAPVGPADVVATARALAAARPAAWGAWVDAAVVDQDTVRLTFDRPFAAWAALLSRPPGVLPAHVLEEGGLDAFADELPVTGGWFRLEGREPGVSMAFVAHDAGPLGPPLLASVDVLVVPGHETALGLLDEARVDVVLGHVALDAPARRAGLTDVAAADVFGGTRVELVWPDGGGDAAQRLAAASRLDPGPFVEGLLRDGGRAAGGLTPPLAPLPRPGTVDAGGTAVVQLPRTVEGLGLLARRLQADLANAGTETTLVRLDPPEHLDPPVPTDAHLRLVRVDPWRSMAALAAEVGLATASGLAADAAGHVPVDPMGAGGEVPASLRSLHEALGADPRVLPLAELAVTHVWDPTAVTGLRPSAWPGIGLWNVGEWMVPEG